MFDATLRPLITTPLAYFNLTEHITSPKPARTILVATVAVAMLPLWAVTATTAPRGARSTPATVAQSDATRARFTVDVAKPVFTPSPTLPGFEKITIAGYGQTGAPGEPPVLSRRYLVALPPTGAYSVSTRIVASEPLGTHRLEPVPTPILIDGDELGPVTSERVDWDEAVYRNWAAPNVVSQDEPVFIRRQRVLPLAVNPLFYDAATNELVVATRIEVDVRFEGGSSRTLTSVAPETGEWNDAFGRLFVNCNQARAWRAPKPALAATTGVFRGGAPGAVKVRVRDTGVHKVSAATLFAAGFPAGQPVGNLRLYRRTYNDVSLTPGETEVPLYVREGTGGVAGVFDANDLVVFYGLRLRDDASQGDTREQYASANVYWLEPGAGTAMTTRAPAPGFVSADTTTAFFTATGHFEIDTFFRDGTPAVANDIYYVATARQAGPVDLAFQMGAIRPGGSLGLSAELHGGSYVQVLRTIRVSLANSKGDLELDPNYIINQKNRQTFNATIPAANLDVGINNFRIARPAGSTRSLVDAFINFVEISYGSLYRARGNTLKFNSAALAGDTTITVTGLSSTTDFELFDITAPTAPVRCVTGPSHFTAVTGGFAFAFRENFPARRDFVLVPVARMIDVAAADVTLDNPSAIIGDPAEGGIDVLVVAHASYLSQMQTWASYRRAQGYRVLLVDVEDVFDEFNGGVPHALAVQRFARHFFERGDASALVLVGDASEDHKKVHFDSGTDFVPTFTRIDVLLSPREDQVVTTDKRYVKMPGPGGVVDDYPDMIVGRIPVGNTTELEIVLAKTFDFESPDESEFWRKRMIIVADDKYSAGGAGVGVSNQYCWFGEGGFETGQENVAQTIENSLPAGYDVIRLFLRDYTSNFYPCTPNPPFECGLTTDCALATAVWAYTRQTATTRLMDELNQGATLVMIQSHMNRSTVTHERLLSTEGAGLIGIPNKDHLRMENRGRPWIIIGMGCHFSDYTVAREAGIQFDANAPNGDAFAEQLLLQNNVGAVGTYGSSGYEFLGANNQYMNVMADVWFYDAPYDTMVEQTQAEWKFGQLMFLVESQLAGFQRDPVERYHILGDPLLQIDAGPPAFNVTVNGNPIATGEVVSSGGEGDTIRVVAVVTDENAIRDFDLEIAGVDMSDSLTIQALTDPTLPRARQYQLSFAHKLRPENYDIVLRAYQAPDTLAGSYHIAAEFLLRVEASIEVSVNGRVIASGGSVPAKGNYRIDLSFPIFVEGSEIGVFMDDVPVSPFALSNPSPEDSLSWIITFQKTLDPGSHALRVTAGPTIQFDYQLVVSDEAGLSDVLNFPNPMRDGGTHFMYSNQSEITDGSIDIYTSTGKRVRRLEIPPGSRFPGSNAVFWDGRDGGGGELANGTYLYVINVQQRGGSATARGKLSKLQ